MSRCDSCTGVCCTRAGNPLIDLLEPDVVRLANSLGLSTTDFKSRYVVAPAPGKSAWVGTLIMTPNAEAPKGSACVFWKSGRCTNYEARPDVCRDFDELRCQMFVPLAALKRDP